MFCRVTEYQQQTKGMEIKRKATNAALIPNRPWFLVTWQIKRMWIESWLMTKK